jgi:hypothetical protein
MELPDLDIADEAVLSEVKKWLFHENMRLENLESSLEDERKLLDIQKKLLQNQQRKNNLLKVQLENQKALFEKQWELLERETRQLAADKDAFKRDRNRFRDEVERETRRNVHVSANAKVFFNGVTDSNSLKKRYRDLLKIFHPDNQNGDNGTILAIQTEYDRLKAFYK